MHDNLWLCANVLTYEMLGLFNLIKTFNTVLKIVLTNILCRVKKISLMLSDLKNIDFLIVL